MKSHVAVGGLGPAFVLAMLVAAAAGHAADCPPGAQKLGEVRQGKQIITTCKCAAEHTASHQQCVPKLPTIAPAFFESPEHVAFVQAELVRLQARRDRLQKQLASLEALRGRQDEYLRELMEIRQQVAFDGVSSVLQLGASTEFLELVKVPPSAIDAVSKSSLAMKSAVESLAALNAGPDRERARGKIADTAAASLRLLAASQAPESYRKAMAAWIEASTETVKTVDAVHGSAGQPLIERVRKAADGVMGVAAAFNVEVLAARSTIEALGNGYVFYRVQTDKDSIVNALVSAQRAKLAADQRLAATESQIAFYETELKKAGK